MYALLILESSDDMLLLERLLSANRVLIYKILDNENMQSDTKIEKKFKDY